MTNDPLEGRRCRYCNHYIFVSQLCTNFGHTVPEATCGVFERKEGYTVAELQAIVEENTTQLAAVVAEEEVLDIPHEDTQETCACSDVRYHPPMNNETRIPRWRCAKCGAVFTKSPIFPKSPNQPEKEEKEYVRRLELD